jgi:hypothetical protein
MASSSPTTSIPIQEPVFLQFLHDVHREEIGEKPVLESELT